MLTPQDIVKWFQGSKVGQTILAEREADTRAKRLAIVQDREPDRKQHEKLAADLRAKRDAAFKRLMTIEPEYLKARGDAYAAEGALLDESYAYDMREGHRQRELRETADERIDVFMDKLNALHEDLRRRPDHAWKEFEGWSKVTGKKVYANKSDHEMVVLALAEIRDVRAEAVALKLQVVDDVEAALTALWESLPELVRIDRKVA